MDFFFQFLRFLQMSKKLQLNYLIEKIPTLFVIIRDQFLIYRVPQIGTPFSYLTKL